VRPFPRRHPENDQTTSGFIFDVVDIVLIGESDGGAIVAYRGGGIKISPRINFGGQISSLGIPTKFSGPFLRKPTKIFRRKIFLPKIFGAFGAPLFLYLCIYVFYVFMYFLIYLEKTPQIFPGDFNKNPPIFSFAKIVPCKIC
jgi:hypothetical protein